jgi:hypothetical protein
MNINPIQQKQNLFTYACKKGVLELAQRLVHFPIDIHAYDEVAFRSACFNNHLELAQWLTLTCCSPINIHVYDESVFRCACYNGHLEVAKWLVDYTNSIHSPIDIHALDEYAFRYACKKGHLEVVQWLVSLCPEMYSFEIVNGKIKYHIEKKLKRLPSMSTFETTCSICLETPSNCQTVCKHDFCYDCLNTWFQSKNTCPYCRSNISECFV